MAPTDYSAPFLLEGPVGNNAFSYDRRGPAPTLWVPAAADGTFDDVAPGDRVVFEEFDEHGTRQSCTGLARLVRTAWSGVPTVVVDNHNHAFYFWCEAALAGRLEPGATLVHVDQHRDMRVPERMYDGASLEDAFAYTNFLLNVGNYIVPARHAGLVGDMQMVTGETALRDLAFTERRNKILNIDLDFFAPEMSDIDLGLAARFIDAHLKSASLITIATSPFFIDQARAIRVLHALRAPESLRI